MGKENKNIEHKRHTLAHLLAAAVQELYPGAKPTIGPAIDNGFYYDFDFPAKKPGEDDLPRIEEKMRELLPAWKKFSAEEISVEEAKNRYKDNPYKQELIDEIIEKGEKITLYTSGGFTDLCRGGHAENPADDIDLGSFALTRTAGAYWRGDEQNPMLTRIYGIAFNTKKELEEHQEMLKEAKKRDHRKLGTKLDLFSQHELSPGSIFWHPKGMLLWRELEALIREKNDTYGYGEVSTPVMTKKELFETSGHWEHYRDNGFWFDLDEETYVLKPMNCPASTLIYSGQLRSYRDLPLRLAEPTGKLHRNELRGVLGGLFRLRQFVQDDAHVYCRPDQIEEEVQELLRYTQEVYELFDLPVSFKFATKPDKAMGSDKLWRQAETALEAVLKDSEFKYEEKPKDGAFYGPKIDVYAKDALGRDHQLATIQLDFQMPERFELEYIDEDGNAQRPVMIHRAILGSFERFLGVLIEHFAGAFPTWLAPVQIVVLPVSDEQEDYAHIVKKTLEEADIRVELPAVDESLGKRIRNAEKQKTPYMLIVGDNEKEASTVTVRQYGSDEQEELALNDFVEKITKKIQERSLE